MFVFRKPENETENKKLNVLVIGLDTVSRQNFHRQMPSTLAYLLNELEGIEFYGYNKVGNNTFPNLMPAFAGLSEDEILKSGCIERNKYDNCHFIFDQFNKSGYITALGEDAAFTGMFNYIRDGFFQQPVHHMWNTFDYEAESRIGHGGPYSNMCLFSRLTVEYLVEYILKFVRAYRQANRNYFGLFWETTMTHDNLNYDPILDRLYKGLLATLSREGIFDDTILFVMSDHGMRAGGITNTVQGQMEDRLPTFVVVVPEKLKAQYPDLVKNLRRNARRLTSPFDLYETLKAIAHGDFSTSNPDESDRGIILFRRVPSNRTCNSAGIPAEWCTCIEGN